MQFKGNPNIRLKWLIQPWNLFIFNRWGPVCSLLSAPCSWGRWLGFRVNEESVREATAHSSPIIMEIHFLSFLSFLRFSISISIQMLTFLLPALFPLSLDMTVYLIALQLSGHQTTTDRSTGLKRSVVSQQGAAQQAWGRQLTRAWFWGFGACDGSSAYWPPAGLSAPLVPLLPSSVQFPSLIWGPGSMEQWLWHFPGRWDTWTQVAFPQVPSSRCHPFRSTTNCDYLGRT